MDFDRKAFAVRLKRVCQQSGKNMRQIAVECDLPEPLFEMYLTGDEAPRAKDLYRLCVCLSISADWLLGLEALLEKERWLSCQD